MNKNELEKEMTLRQKSDIACHVFFKGVVPCFFYFFLFLLFTYPLIMKFSSHFFADTGDGLQNVWNIWWVNKAVTELHQLPWQTNYLHFPFGTSLIAHTLNPFNGFLGIILLKFLSLTETYNFIVLFSFVIGGLTAFWLAYYLTRSYAGSLVGGFIFTFSSFHFSHAEGHLQIVALEWIPLFVLCWYVFLIKPSMGLAVLTAVVLFFVILCDYYYFFYCLLAAGLITIWTTIRRKRLLFLFRRPHSVPLLVFLTGFLLTSFPLAAALFRFSRKHELVGAHDSGLFSLDLLAAFIPGGHWRFADVTKFYWSRLTGGIHETSVYLGISVLFLLLFVYIRRKSSQMSGLKLWYGLMVFFWVMSLGPVLQVYGERIAFVKLPYAALEAVLPFLKLGGVPIRMMVMVTLCASVIAASGLKILIEGRRGFNVLAFFLLALLCVEYLPKTIPRTRIQTPEYVEILKRRDGDRGLLDTVSDQTHALYYQTIHQKPLAFGYVSRYPVDTEKRNQRIRQLLDGRDFYRLYWGYHFRYWLTEERLDFQEIQTPIELLYVGGGIRLYDFGVAWIDPGDRLFRPGSTSPDR